MSGVTVLVSRTQLLPVTLLRAGHCTHAEVDAVMQEMQRQRIAGEIQDTLIFVEHPEVITVGRRAKIDDISAPTGYASLRRRVARSRPRRGHYLARTRAVGGLSNLPLA